MCSVACTYVMEEPKRNTTNQNSIGQGRFWEKLLLYKLKSEEEGRDIQEEEWCVEEKHQRKRGEHMQML